MHAVLHGPLPRALDSVNNSGEYVRSLPGSTPTSCSRVKVSRRHPAVLLGLLLLKGRFGFV